MARKRRAGRATYARVAAASNARRVRQERHLQAQLDNAEEAATAQNENLVVDLEKTSEEQSGSQSSCVSATNFVGDQSSLTAQIDDAEMQQPHGDTDDATVDVELIEAGSSLDDDMNENDSNDNSIIRVIQIVEESEEEEHEDEEHDNKPTDEVTEYVIVEEEHNSMHTVEIEEDSSQCEILYVDESDEMYQYVIDGDGDGDGDADADADAYADTKRQNTHNQDENDDDPDDDKNKTIVFEVLNEDEVTPEMEPALDEKEEQDQEKVPEEETSSQEQFPSDQDIPVVIQYSDETGEQPNHVDNELLLCNQIEVNNAGASVGVVQFDLLPEATCAMEIECGDAKELNSQLLVEANSITPTKDDDANTSTIIKLESALNDIKIEEASVPVAATATPPPLKTKAALKALPDNFIKNLIEASNKTMKLERELKEQEATKIQEQMAVVSKSDAISIAPIGLTTVAAAQDAPTSPPHVSVTQPASDAESPSIRRSTRIKTISQTKQRSRGHGLVKDRERFLKQNPVIYSKHSSHHAAATAGMTHSLGGDDDGSGKPTPTAASHNHFVPPVALLPLSLTADNHAAPVKVKSRWRRSSELEMGVVSTANTVTAATGAATTIASSFSSGSSLGPAVQQSSTDVDNAHEFADSQSPITSVPMPGDMGSTTTEEVAAIVSVADIDANDIRLSQFLTIAENEYHCERTISKEARKMTCDCFLTHEEIDRGELGCGEDCLNRLLMIECSSRCTVGDRCTNRRFQRSEYSDCRVFRTEKKGFGIMASSEIGPNEFIMEYVGEVLNGKQFGKRAKDYSKDKNKHYYFMALKSDAVIDATHKGNISRFINHSCDPNAETQKWTVNGELRIGFFTTRTVIAGEEITFDYQFQRYGKEAQKCFCEAANCRGWIGEEPESSSDGESDDGVDSVDSDTDIEQEAAKVTTTSDSPAHVKQPKKIVTTRVKRKYTKRKKRTEILDDADLDDEINAVERTGLKNQTHTLRLSRLMVRAKLLVARSRLLTILRDGQLPCRRLFLDYHGLRLLHGWMCDAAVSNTHVDLQFRVDVLTTLELLPIPNKTMLKDSRVLATIEKWAVAITEHEQSPNETPPDSGTVTPVGQTSDGSLQVPSDALDDFRVESTTLTVGLNADEQMATLRKTISEQSTKLIALWANLPEVFRIPKKERIEQMKEHEREADRKSVEPLPSDEDPEKLRERYKDRYRERVGGNGAGSTGTGTPQTGTASVGWVRNDRRFILPIDPTKPKMTKEERRQMFAQKVAQEERNRRNMESWKIHEGKCLSFGLDPNLVTPNDVPAKVDTTTGQWYSLDNRLVSTPPSHAHIVVPKPLYPCDSKEYYMPKLDLPKLWRCAVSNRGHIYYYHIKTFVAQWEPPVKVFQAACATRSEQSPEKTATDATAAVDNTEEELFRRFMSLLVRKRRLHAVERRSQRMGSKVHKRKAVVDPLPVAAAGAIMRQSDTDALPATTANDESGGGDRTPQPTNDDILNGSSDFDPPCNIAAIDSSSSSGNCVATTANNTPPVHTKKRQRIGLVQERIISPRREEDRIYGQMEMKRYRETKEKLRRRKDELKRRRIQENIMSSSSGSGVGSHTSSSGGIDEVPRKITKLTDNLPIVADNDDFLYDSDEEQPLMPQTFHRTPTVVNNLQSINTSSPQSQSLPYATITNNLMDKIVSGQQRVDELDLIKDGSDKSNNSQQKYLNESQSAPLPQPHLSLPLALPLSQPPSSSSLSSSSPQNQSSATIYDDWKRQQSKIDGGRIRKNGLKMPSSQTQSKTVEIVLPSIATSATIVPAQLPTAVPAPLSVATTPPPPKKRKLIELATVVSSSAHEPNSDEVRRIKDKFRSEIAKVVVHYLNPFRKDTSPVGHISTNDDFKHLARKLTHTVMLKELKHCDNTIQDLVVTDSVRTKAKEYIKKYMAKLGPIYQRPENEPDF